ncbi:MAG TPA: ribosome recycling factor [Candidatus Marinimicrobia bacterium]|nr:ribosome recycling factor [Candidatus Neomarinimicrobiota bacterium]
MINDIHNDAKQRMDQAIEHTRMELTKVRTGRANPELVETLVIDYYGTKTPLNQLSNINVPEPRLITVQPFDKTVMADIERAIMKSNLGLTPNNNGEVILIPIPPLSEERRKDLAKVVHQLVEEGRVSVRNVRKDANHHIKIVEDDGHISEDEIKRAEQEIQDLTDKHITRLNEMMDYKEKELMEF